MLPSEMPLQLIGQDGRPGGNPGSLELPPPDILRQLHRRMVLGRRFDAQSTALTKQGKLAVYPSSHGQDACQGGAPLALRPAVWRRGHPARWRLPSSPVLQEYARRRCRWRTMPQGVRTRWRCREQARR